jgi:GNAT superfamily N-acetyltransferase
VAAVTVRKASTGDEPRLRELAARSKSHWGYGSERVDAWAAGLDLATLGSAAAEIYVADDDGRAVGWLALVARGDVCEVDHLWIEPERIRQGVGTLLFRFAVERARELGASRLELESEPNAVGFYEKLGATRVGETVGSWGRSLPVLAVELAG